MLAFRGTLVHSTWQNALEVLEDHVVVVRDGKIVNVCAGDKADEVLHNNGLTKGEVVQLGESEFLMPGLVDTHIHAPQYVYTGTALDLPLLDWLNQYTFPIEASFKDTVMAEDAYTKAVNRVLKNGTTTACWFATIHLEASLKLADIVEKLGQRAYIGKVNMNCNSPDYYIETTKESIDATEKFIQKMKEKDNPLVMPIVTPRFAPSCDADLLQQLGDIAQGHQLHIQSHLSENKAEVQWIKELFPDSKSYSDVYDRYGLFNNKTVMAHCVYLSDDELDLMKERGVGVAHCPNSNLSISSGMCDVRRMLDRGIKVGLATDVSGGFSPSILDALRLATQVSNMMSLQHGQNYKKVDFREAFRLATLGGSQVLGLDKKIGNFEEGKEFDALRINPLVPNSPYDLFPRDTLLDTVQKFLYLGDDRNIMEVYVAGNKVVSK